VGDRVGHGGFFLGLLLVLGGCVYRISVGNPGGPPPDPAEDQRAIWTATVLMIAGGIVTLVCGIAGYIADRRRRRVNASPAEPGAADVTMNVRPRPCEDGR
jgi:hypothetical protein